MTIRDYTEQAVRKYIRTVLLVDDQLFKPESNNPSKQARNTSPRVIGIPNTATESASTSDGEQKPAENSEKPPQNFVGTGSSPTTEPFSAQAVVDGFSQLGIVCGLYQPNTADFSDGAIPESMVNLCDHSDVFILDWKLKKEQASSPVPAFLVELFNHDESIGVPRAIRFCAIYTEEALGSVFSTLHSEIKARFPQMKIEEDIPKYRIRFGGLTIRLFRKTDDPEAAGNSKRFVSSSDLAKTIVQDFVDEYEGIMSATALHGIAEVRRNAKRILDKFQPSLDYAFAIHSGLTISNPTVPEDLSGLLSDEISAIIQEAAPKEEMVHELLATKISELPDSCFSSISADKKLVAPETTDTVVKRYFVDLFRNHASSSPFVESEVNCEDHIIGRQLLERLQSLALSLAGNQNYTEGDLSKLFCQRTVYGNNRVLKSGTIVRDSDTGQYYLCLMPPCDSVRLKSAKVFFPFWKLSQIQPISEAVDPCRDLTGRSSTRTGQSHGLIVTEQDGSTKRLCLKGKIKDRMSLWQFKADKVVQFVKDGSSFFITEYQRGSAGAASHQKTTTVTTMSAPKKFEWVAELKPLHAQRMAEYVSRQFSRVGVAESEWLRLQVDG